MPNLRWRYDTSLLQPDAWISITDGLTGPRTPRSPMPNRRSRVRLACDLDCMDGAWTRRSWAPRNVAVAPSLVPPDDDDRLDRDRLVLILGIWDSESRRCGDSVMQIVQRRGRTTELVTIATQDSGIDYCLIRDIVFLGSRLGSWQLGHGLRSFFATNGLRSWGLCDCV